MSASVSDIQSWLNAHGYADPPLAIDGLDGPATQAAVENFQRERGLTVDGKAGPQTLGAMGFASDAAATWREVSDRPTPVSANDAAKAFAAAYRQVTGSSASPAILGLLLAQAAFETGSFGAGIHNYNFGNAKASSCDKFIQYFSCTERDADGNVVTYDPPSPVCRFAAYSSPTEGAVAFIKLLKSRPHWWAGLQTGTTQGFAAGLAQSPEYFTEIPSIYAAGLARELAQYAAMAAKYAGASGAVIAMVALGLGAAAWALYRFGGIRA